MECGFIKENLFAITEKQLPAEELARVIAHLETCGECKARAEFFALAEEGVLEMKQAEPDPFISTRTLAMFESGFQSPVPHKSFQTRLLYQPVVIALFLGFAIFAGIFSGMYGYRQHNQAVTSSATEMLKSELALEEVVFEESGMLMLE